MLESLTGSPLPTASSLPAVLLLMAHPVCAPASDWRCKGILSSAASEGLVSQVTWAVVTLERKT